MQFLTFLQLVSILHLAVSVKIEISKKPTLATPSPIVTTTFLPETETTDAKKTNDEITTTISTTVASKSEGKDTIIKDEVTAKSPFPPKLPKTTTAPELSKPSTLNISTSTDLPPIMTTTPTDPNKNFCFCNLLSNACDINCCCDPDCSKDIIKVFNCYELQPLHAKSNGILYQHGLPSCMMNDGWLCVIRVNVEKQTNKDSVLDLNPQHYYQWPNLPLYVSTEIDERKYYKYGDAIMLLNLNKMSAMNFDIPFAYEPPYCQGHQSIRHLVAAKSLCSVASSEEIQESKSKILNLLSSTKLLRIPITSIDNGAKLSEYRLKWCQDNRCINLKDDFNSTDNSPFGNTLKITIRIMHNFTDIFGAMIEIEEKQIDTNEMCSHRYWIINEVQFVVGKHFATDDYSLVPSKLQSGPLGYSIGEPIIFSKYIESDHHADMMAQNRLIDYFTNGTQQQNTLSLFTKSKHFCDRNDKPENYISFGINTFKECQFRMRNETITYDEIALLNLTALCIEFQELIMTQFLGSQITISNLADVVASQLGKPQNRSDKWVKLNLKDTEFAPITAQFDEATQTFTCRNMILNVAFEFYTIYATEESVPKQGLLKHVSITLGNRQDLEFELNEPLQVPLSVSVMFYDSSNSGLFNTASNYHYLIIWTIIAFSIINFHLTYVLN